MIIWDRYEFRQIVKFPVVAASFKLSITIA